MGEDMTVGVEALPHSPRRVGRGLWDVDSPPLEPDQLDESAGHDGVEGSFAAIPSRSARDVIGLLRADHAYLRTRLGLLEGAMRVAPEAQEAWREMCVSLTQGLKEHIGREEQVLAPYRDQIQARLNECSSQDYADQRGVLIGLQRLLGEGLQAPGGGVVTRLTRLSDELREHMNEVEREVFPMVNRLGTRPVQGRATLWGTGHDH